MLPAGPWRVGSVRRPRWAVGGEGTCSEQEQRACYLWRIELIRTAAKRTEAWWVCRRCGVEVQRSRLDMCTCAIRGSRSPQSHINVTARFRYHVDLKVYSSMYAMNFLCSQYYIIERPALAMRFQEHKHIPCAAGDSASSTADGRFTSSSRLGGPFLRHACLQERQPRRSGSTKW